VATVFRTEKAERSTHLSRKSYISINVGVFSIIFLYIKA